MEKIIIILSVLVGLFLVWKQSRRKGLSEEQVLDIFLLVIIVALIGGRLGYGFADLPKALLFARYPGFSIPAALLSGVLAAIAFAKMFSFSPLMILDLFTIAFSWSAILVFTLSANPVMLVCSIIAAVFLGKLSQQVNNDPELITISRQHGLFFSSYLIFMMLFYLIFDRQYLVVLIPAVIFFIVKYRKAIKMIKFPDNILKQVKTYLEQKSHDTEKRIRQLKKEDPFEDKGRLLDRAADDTEAQVKTRHERIEAMQQQLGFALAQTRKALTKIKIGKYGICEECGKMIDTDRLAVMPAATLCISCEKKKEK